MASPEGNRTLVVGHRGNSGLAPENTAIAFAQARSAGADMVETDVRLSADGVLFLFHDGTGHRTTNLARVFPDREDAPITSFTAAELRRLDTGGYFSEQFAGERIMFLSELPAAVGFALGVNLEIKAPRESPGVEQALAAALTGEADWVRLRQTQRIAVSSFDTPALRTFHEAAPGIPIWQLADAAPDTSALAEGSQWLEGVVLDHRFLTAAGAAAVHSVGLGLWTYTVNEIPEMSRMIGLGAEAVITDFPAVLAGLVGTNE